MQLVVLRLGHRPQRDQRMSTHLALVARALGADGMLITVNDRTLLDSISKLVENWGGNFWVEFEPNWRAKINRWKSQGGKLVHLTMYGINLPQIIPQIRAQSLDQDRDLMVVVGAEKVPPELYQLADWNVAVTHQPHSEIAALAIFLDWLFQGKELDREFPGAKLKIIPSSCGKQLLRQELS